MDRPRVTGSKSPAIVGPRRPPLFLRAGDCRRDPGPCDPGNADRAPFGSPRCPQCADRDFRFYPLNFYATCGEVVHQHVHYLFGCGYAALDSILSTSTQLAEKLYTSTFTTSLVAATPRWILSSQLLRNLRRSCTPARSLPLWLRLRRVGFYPLNFYATCGEVVHQHVHYLFGCGYAALGTGRK